MYDIVFTSEAENDLANLNKQIAQRILKKLRWLAENFELITPEPLTGQWQGWFKFRVGDYRIVYQFNRPEERIIVHLIKHRREVYKSN